MSEAGTGRETTDAAARERALAATGSLIVRAPAGSGKTGLLIQRFLRLLASVEEPEAVVALTFSRKAAEEMRGRLLRALETADEEAPADSHARRSWELARAVRARDAERGWKLLETPARLRVMTLDGFALGLVERMPWLSRFGAAPNPAEDARELYRAAARATVLGLEENDAAAEAARRLLRHVNADLDAAAAMLADLLEQRDQWIPWLGIGGGRAQLRTGIEGEAAAAVRRELDAIAAELAGLGVHPLPAGASREDWFDLAENCLNREGEPRKRKRNAQAPPPLPLDPAACAVLHQVRTLPAPVFADGQWEVLEALFDLLPHALAELRLVFAGRGECDFTEITLAAAEALGTAEAPSALAFALDAKIQHLFVDEFQDTSVAQNALLQALAADWTEGDGRTLFLVGDPMQSIYGWRNAQIGLFLRAAGRRQLGPLRLDVVELSSNYRSEPGLVAWCNRIFGHPGVGVAADDAVVGGAKFVAEVAARRGSEAGAEMHLQPGSNPEVEAMVVADLVEAALAERGEKAEIAILAQAKTHLGSILPELQRRGIRYQGVNLLSLAESEAVGDLLALTRALAHPADRVAWLAVLRAPWCGLTLEDLTQLCGGEREAAIPTLLQGADRCARLSPDGQQRLAPVAAILQAAARQWGRVGLRSLVEWCWQALGGAALSPGREADAHAFFDLLAAWEARGAPGGIAGIEETAAKLCQALDPLADGRVKVMTAHHAKGLEFDTVILPGLGREPRADQPALLRWMDWPASDGDGAEMRGLIVPRAASGKKDDLYQFVSQLRERRRQQEQLRLLYVAATRAKRRLHLVAFAPGEKPKPRSPLARVWAGWESEAARMGGDDEIAGAEFALQSSSRREAAGALPNPEPVLLRRAAAGWLPPGAGSENLGADKPGGGAGLALDLFADLPRQVGTAVHGILRVMAERGELTWNGEQLRRLLLAAGVGLQDLGAAMQTGTRALAQTVGDAQGRWILQGGNENRCEWELTGWIGGRVDHRVVDRSFVDEAGQRWVIDYKTGSPMGQDREEFLERQVERYRPQLAAYAELIMQLEPGRPVRCGLYFPQIPVWREVSLDTHQI